MTLPVVVQSGVRLSVHRVDGKLLGISDEEEPEVFPLAEADLDGWQIDFQALMDYLHRENGLDGVAEKCTNRLWVVGVSGETLVALALFGDASMLESEVLSLSARLPESVRGLVVFCPSLAIPALMLGRLTALRVRVFNLDPEDPFRLPAIERASSPSGSFSYSPGYRSVTLPDLPPFTLTPRQAAVIGILHRAHRAGRPDMAWSEIKEQLKAVDEGFYAERIQDIFRRVPDWQELVTRMRKGFYRLNI